MKNYFIIAIVSTLLLSGCSSAEPNPIVTQSKTIETIESYQPDWIINSNKDGYLCNIGYSKLNKNLAITKKIANIEAKANISQDIQSHIKTQIELETNCKNEECKDKYSSKINITSKQMIRNVKIVNQYTDTKKGIYYIHLCMKI